MTKKIIYRSAITGRFVTKRYSQKHPKTTVREKTRRELKQIIRVAPTRVTPLKKVNSGATVKKHSNRKKKKPDPGKLFQTLERVYKTEKRKIRKLSKTSSEVEYDIWLVFVGLE